MAISDGLPLLGKQQTCHHERPNCLCPSVRTGHTTSTRSSYTGYLTPCQTSATVWRCPTQCLPTAPCLWPRPWEHHVPGHCPSQQHVPLAISAQNQTWEVRLPIAHSGCSPELRLHASIGKHRPHRARSAVGVVLPPLSGGWKQRDGSQLTAEELCCWIQRRPAVNC